ncbi:delta-lactam-biosynthetic de-N-acetylase [Paraclostridium ghonii]|uniref:delta-lactam-biosynthetic de-N-acetylase n=1 Tax=Paraclostridium ghonii TaxID=29358 RepID=UPI00202CB20C|nr:delta-lactam-biosynthetic de-N-acetylase [Paeniclostridium ghonii]MCM0166672.1 delta-lactam-biosynthetic de-N-acetylase [Paeniclostridium ghonii]
MNNQKKRNSFFIIAFFIISAFLVGGKFDLFDKIKTQILNTDQTTKEYSWYFNPRNDGKQPTPIKEASFFKKYNAYYVGNTAEKVLYLTFDAGYESGNTEKILDTLKKHNAPAAFFVVDHYLKSNPEMVKRMTQEGHLVCNHSKSHPSMASITDFDKFKEEIVTVENRYKEITGKSMPKYFRPPMGKFSEKSLEYTQELGYDTIFWSFAYVDWYENKQPSHEEAKQKIFTRTHPGAILLLHPNSKTNADILDDVLTHWEQEGYTVKSLDHLTKKKSSNNTDLKILENK